MPGPKLFRFSGVYGVFMVLTGLRVVFLRVVGFCGKSTWSPHKLALQELNLEIRRAQWGFRKS